MEAKKALEARVFTRADLIVEVTLESEHNFFVGKSENISEGGLFVLTEEVRPLGTVVSVELSLPECPEPIRACGEVRWVRKRGEAAPGIGVRFFELRDADLSTIRRFVEERAPMFWE